MSVRMELGDCLAHMAELPDASVDAVVMDPPYCSGGVSEAGRSQAKSQGVCSERRDDVDWFKGDNMGTSGIAWLLRAIAFQSCRVLRPSGSVLCFMDWRQVPNLVPAIESSGLRYQNLIVWDKGQAAMGNGFRATHEMCAHFTNGEFSAYNKTPGNVLRHSRVRSGDREHFAQKPVELLREMISVVCPPGGTVLDPFAGSGSTLVAAQALGMSAIGFERDAGYIEIAKARTGYAQSELFK